MMRTRSVKYHLSSEFEFRIVFFCNTVAFDILKKQFKQAKAELNAKTGTNDRFNGIFGWGATILYQRIPSARLYVRVLADRAYNKQLPESNRQVTTHFSLDKHAVKSVPPHCRAEASPKGTHMHT